MATVLIGDDDAIVRRSLQRLLPGESRTVSNPRELVLEAERWQPSIIVTDQNFGFGELTGIELLPQLRRVTPRAQVIVIAGTYEDGESARAIAAGAFSYASKNDPRLIRALVLAARRRVASVFVSVSSRLQ